MSLFSACTNIISISNDASNGNNKVFLLEKHFAIEDINTVLAVSSGGSIQVDGNASDSARIEVYGQGNNGKPLTKAEILEIIERDYNFSVRKIGNALEARSERRKNAKWKNAINISYVIHVAREVNTDLTTSGGSIQLENLEGNQSFKTSGGSLRLSGLNGKIDGRTNGGSIRISDSEGSIVLYTSGGSIRMRGLKGNLLAHTSGGSIRGQQVSGRLNTRTSGGSIRLSEIDAELEAKTSGGSIQADFAAFTQAAKLQTSAGSIRLQIPANAALDFELEGSSVDIADAENLQVNYNKRGDQAQGRLNEGGPKLEASTSAGSVELHF